MLGCGTYRADCLVLKLKDHLANLPGAVRAFDQDVIDGAANRPGIAVAAVGHIMYVFDAGSYLSPATADHPYTQAADKVPSGVKIAADFPAPAINQAVSWHYSWSLTA